MSCTVHDTRCIDCRSNACLSCADLLLTSIQRSGARLIDHSLPEEEGSTTRPLSHGLQFLSQSSLYFMEAEPYFVVSKGEDAPLLPLYENARACTQGLHKDKEWDCSPINTSHRVCGHFGTLYFEDFLYTAIEGWTDLLAITVRRTGGGFGRVKFNVGLEHVTTSASDLSLTTQYNSQTEFTFEVNKMNFHIIYEL